MLFGMDRVRIVLVFFGTLALIFPLPYSGEEEPRTYDGRECTTDWKGVAPVPMAAYEAVATRRPPFAYVGEGGTLCQM